MNPRSTSALLESSRPRAGYLSASHPLIRPLDGDIKEILLEVRSLVFVLSLRSYTDLSFVNYDTGISSSRQFGPWPPNRLQSHAAKLLEDSREGRKDDYVRTLRPWTTSPRIERPMRLPAQLSQHLTFYGDCGGSMNGIQTFSGSLRGGNQTNYNAMEGLRMASIFKHCDQATSRPSIAL